MTVTDIQISIELAEKSVLGSMLQENYLVSDSDLDKEHFSIHIHKNIFAAMQELISENKAVDYITLLSKREPTELGGANYLADLKNFASPIKFEQHCELIVDYWRDKMRAQILHQAQVENWSIQQIQKAFDDLITEKTKVNTSIKADLLKIIERPYNPSAVRKGITTGLRDLDVMLNGFHDGELTIIGARPSMGKTDTLDHFAITAGLAGYQPIYFSLEMERDTLIDRLMAATGNFNRSKLRDTYTLLSEEQKVKWVETTGILDKTNMEIDDRPGLTVPQIRSSARRIIKNNSNRKPIIFIDYLQIITPNNPKENQTQAMGQVSRDLKFMAREFKCPVVCLAQLNRGVEQRSDKRPMMSDLRDSGNIEQDADVIAFLYRDEYYDKESESKNMLEIIIAKQRNGPTGTVTVAYSKETGRLLNINWGAAK